VPLKWKNTVLKACFFVMTVSINRPNYLTKEQIAALSDTGNVIAAHTWDHHRVTKYTGDDWNTQLIKPKAKLEEITGRPVTYFAYPFGLWNKEVIRSKEERISNGIYCQPKEIRSTPIHHQTHDCFWYMDY
jgi:peptidoglycan/xylan/chitin deacetylase (PgdA/CDA1 family)